MPNSGTASDMMLNLAIPTAAMIQPVNVVPILAPMMTPIACVSDKSPAFTKVISITVVADDDCTRIVTIAPVSTPTMLFFVIMFRALWRRSPAAR